MKLARGCGEPAKSLDQLTADNKDNTNNVPDAFSNEKHSTAQRTGHTSNNVHISNFKSVHTPAWLPFMPT